MERYTIAQFNTAFPDEDACLDRILRYVYPEGIVCRTCQRERKHHRREGRKSYECDTCGTEVFPMAGTIFEKTTTPLKSWFYAMFIMASTRCGISAKQLQRELGVTYKTAWRMFTQIRKLMAEDGGPLLGFVEVDETFVGGRPRYNAGEAPKGDDGKGKRGPRPKTHPTQQTIVMGAVERGGRVTAQIVADRKARTVMPLVSQHVMPASIVFTDELKSYSGLGAKGYRHHRINHAAHVYVEGNIHTGTIDGFWSLLKNGIRGSHHAVGAAYLQSYVNEYAFRYNHRDDERPMFAAITNRVSKTRHGRYGAYNPVGEIAE
jgi:transposase